MDCEGGDCEEGMGSDCDMGVEPEPPAVKSGMAEVRGAVDGKDRTGGGCWTDEASATVFAPVKG